MWYNLADSVCQIERIWISEQFKRNMDRFPVDFMFQLTDKEKEEVIANCDHLVRIKFSRTNPYVFTEHGE